MDIYIIWKKAIVNRMYGIFRDNLESIICDSFHLNIKVRQNPKINSDYAEQCYKKSISKHSTK